MKTSPYSFLMLSAMYENGGNTTHRLLDGHPELFVYPFESQPGTKYVNDYLSSMYPVKYRWPVFPSHFTPEELYEAIIDEEGKIRSKTPNVSKFRDAKFDAKDADRRQYFVEHLGKGPYTRGRAMEAFFVATFKAWKAYKSSGKEKMYVGYSPIIGVDGDKIIQDYKKNGYVLHVTRNPFSAYADTKKRAVPLSLSHYILGWCVSQYHALLFQKKYPKNFFVLRFEDIVENPVERLSDVFGKMGIGSSKTLGQISWNGKKLDEVYPWGTIRIPTSKQNIKTAKELSSEEMEEIAIRTQMYLDHFGYNELYKEIKK